MRNPKIQCKKCGDTRDCMLHTRAEHPPTAAKKYLKKHCSIKGKPCEFGYTAGLTGSILRGQ